MKKAFHQIKSWATSGRFRPLLLCYAVFLVLWLLFSFVLFCTDRILPQVKLNPAEAQQIDMYMQKDGSFFATSADPQMLFNEISTPARLVYMDATFTRGPGEMELFYTRKQGPGFSTKRRTIGAPVNGGWVYALTPGIVYSLRIDPGTFDYNVMEIGEVTLNPRLPLSYYFGPNLRRVLALALVPALAYAVFYTIIELVNYFGHFKLVFINKKSEKPEKSVTNE